MVKDWIIPKTIEECADLEFLKQFDWRFDFQNTNIIETTLPAVYFEAFKEFTHIEGMRFVAHHDFQTIGGKMRVTAQRETDTHRRGWLYIIIKENGCSSNEVNMLKFIIEEGLNVDKDVLKNDLEALLGMHEPRYCRDEDKPEVKRLLAKLIND
jgi:hypothetical protein